MYRFYKQIKQLKNQDHQELNDILTAFLEELKEENVFLQNKKNQQQDEMNLSKKTPNESDFDILQVAMDKNDGVSTSIEGQAFSLYEQGVTVDEIARKLGRGKTEIELMIKFKR
jgi:DNA-nicking Smr family endonuclease